MIRNSQIAKKATETENPYGHRISYGKINEPEEIKDREERKRNVLKKWWMVNLNQCYYWQVEYD